MPRLLALGFLVMGTTLPQSGHEQAPEPEKVPGSVLLTEGILGGFVPARPRFRVVILEQPDGSARIVVMEQPERGQPTTFRQGTLDAETLSALWHLLEDEKIYDLPVEKPGSESHDVYGLDTSLAVRHQGRSWRNSAPQGCVRGTATLQLTAEQLSTFARLVDRVRALARQAQEPCDEAAFAALEKDAAGPPADAGER